MPQSVVWEIRKLAVQLPVTAVAEAFRAGSLQGEVED
jgi:hypothetical protein